MDTHQLEAENQRLRAEVKHLGELLSYGQTTIVGELRTAEGNLSQRDHDLQSVLDHVPVMVAYWDKDLRNRFGNQTYSQWCGVDAARMAGMHIREVIGEQRYRLNLPRIDAALRGEEQQFELAIQIADGKQLRHSLAHYIPDFVDGQVQGFYAMVTDVSLIKQTQSALREKEELLRGLYEMSPLGIVMADMNGHFVDFNQAFCTVCGYSSEEMKALDHWSLTPKRYAAAEAAQIEKLRSSGHFGPYEKEFLRKDGCLVPVSLNAVLITGSDDRQYIWTIVEDITKRKHAEQLKRVLDEYHELSLGAMERSREQMVTALTRLSLYRDNETGRHIKRTSLYVKALAGALLEARCYTELLSEHSVDLIAKATPMHDLGKVGVPDQILMKPGHLTPDEMRVVQTHATIGESILLVAAGGAGPDDSLLMVASRMAASHHENWDGSGYPRGQKGEDIPLEARLMALADVYDALTTPRVYKRAWSHELASAEILRQKGIKFDPSIVDAYQRVEADFLAIMQEFRDQDPGIP
ncbi:MAG: PAS domain S-box protein [Rhodoferax sp.]